MSSAMEIPNCPKCNGTHRYKLEVERSVVMKMMTKADSNEPRRRVRFKRLFTCPVKDEEYQATFTLTESSSDRIKSVSVVTVEEDR